MFPRVNGVLLTHTRSPTQTLLVKTRLTLHVVARKNIAYGQYKSFNSKRVKK